MHPILFRIPLPKMPLMLWWGLAFIAAIAVVSALNGLRKKDRGTAGVALVIAAGAGVAGYMFRETKFEAANLPIYSYGVMLGLSLVVGWYLTLTLAERDGLPKETMANCYVITAIAAILGSRILYVVTNPDEFKQASDFFALRRGGLVAYGGFLGGYLGSWLYLRSHKIRLMPWADVAVPSLASGLLITRIGCYLFGCDFGKRLPEGAPGFIAKLGTFPQWPKETLEGSEGSPAFARHLDIVGKHTPAADELMKMGHSYPVHPTQIYESLVGLALLVLLLWQRKHQRFRGQIFFLFAFGYGYLRFLIESLRDDSERGEFGPMMGEHWLIAGSLLVMSVAFVFGISLGITNPKVRNVARVAAFVPPLVAFFILKPASFGKQQAVQLSTSQWIGMATAVICAYFYAQFWETARKSPKLAMGLESLGDIKATADDMAPRRKKVDDDEEDDEPHDEAESEEPDDDTAPEAPVAKKPKKKKGLKKKKVAAPAEEEPSEPEGDDEAPKPAASGGTDDAKTEVDDTKVDEKVDEKAEEKEKDDA
ncbi:MAG: prolipoprotein diacylglyceryl transferase [Labilithrix sp.]|nr:prolipoprotein diacylglyceryl transferase [Labilithrix sp.]MCW5817772.1 prolipoprotein diacylglyceryl transferase [Labilithrix sp.]